MLISRLQPSLRTALTTASRTNVAGAQAGLAEAFGALRIVAETRPASLNFVRNASHKAQGAVNKAKDGPGKRLGAKKSGGMHISSIGCQAHDADPKAERSIASEQWEYG